MALRILPGQANMTCADCEHFTYLDAPRGLCGEGGETLILDGFPRAEIIVRDYQSAESCPCFNRSAASILAEPVPGWEEAVDRIYKDKKEVA